MPLLLSQLVKSLSPKSCILNETYSYKKNPHLLIYLIVIKQHRRQFNFLGLGLIQF